MRTLMWSISLLLAACVTTDADQSAAGTAPAGDVARGLLNATIIYDTLQGRNPCDIVNPAAVTAEMPVQCTPPDPKITK